MKNITTFAQLENNLIKLGFKEKSLDSRVSVFSFGELLAFVTYKGLGQGYECSVFELKKAGI